MPRERTTKKEAAIAVVTEESDLRSVGLYHLLKCIVEESAPAEALNELHENRSVFEFAGQRGLLLVQFLDCLARAGREQGLAFVEDAYTLTLRKFQELPSDETKRQLDCRNYFRAVLAFCDKHGIGESVRDETRVAKALQGLVVRQFAFSRMECKRQQNVCVEYTDNVAADLDSFMGSYEPFGVVSVIPVEGISAMVADEKVAAIHEQRPAIRKLGRRRLKKLVIRIFDAIDSEEPICVVAMEFRLSPACMSRFAGLNWKDGGEVPDLWRNTARVIARHPLLVEVAESAGVWNEVTKIKTKMQAP